MSKFYEKVKRGGVVGPRRRNFTLEGWHKAYEELSSDDKRDTLLYKSGKHIHTKLSAIRNTLAQSSLSNLSKITRIKALISAANHQLESMELQIRRQTQEDLGGDTTDLDIRTLASTSLTLAGGESYNVEAVLGGLLDGVVLPIRAALTAGRNDVSDSFNEVNWVHVAQEINLGMLYDQTENLWEDCVWNTYIIGGLDELLAMPLDLRAKLGTHAAAARKLALGIESFSYAIQALNRPEIQALPARIKEVVAVLNEGGQQQIHLGHNKLDSHTQTMLFALRTMACPPYYDSLLDQKQQALGGASLSQLFDVWMVVSQAATRLWERTSAAYLPTLPPPSDELCDMEDYIPCFDTDVLVTAAHKATSVPVPQTQAIIDFLTFQGKGNQEFFTQPLVPTGEKSKLYLLFGAIAKAPNLRYVLERWMAQLEVKLDERGLVFETHIRSEIADAIKDSPMLSHLAKSVSQDYTFKCKDRASVQIDALFCIGSHVFVLEAKCILEPTDSTSIGTHRFAIEHAVEQARTRVKLINDNREDFIADVGQFGWDISLDFHIHPLVAVSTIAHVGVPWDDVPVVDEYVLRKFFEGGYEDVGLDTSDFTIRERFFRPFYGSAEEAESSAADYFKQPPQLVQYSEALRLRDVPIYAASEHDWSGRLIDYEQS